ncbi:M20 family metallo-hydrolase [Pedobacter cryophilus]|uniref:M20/M25/M40 family metallo-hydrolase n=1 Tax=Pedobacter cryophilus TaxID=2571271 RepID=A0A4U1C4U2_9SPHI|nr:M20 family metallo-hydrolase [Pedobacter cryophilus]TKC00332.1 M20/M25/M40 family metallo-hydrolase [Pedobacter cryophilus]
MQDKNTLYENAVELLKNLISTPSLSKEEEGTFNILCNFFKQNEIPCHTKGFNIWAYNKHFDSKKPTILLNSHHDTVKPNKSYSRDPFAPDEENGKLFGLGSNDAGGCLVSLIAAFLHFYPQENLKYNIAVATTAEEENSGKGGIESILPDLGKLDFALVGEPTLMDLAIAEKGLLVLDCLVKGKSGHAARNEGDNAIYKALQDIEWFQNYQFTKVSETLGPIKMTVTMINAGSLHNVVPDQCLFTVDVRITDAYNNEDVLKIIRSFVSCEVTPRSVRLKPSSIPKEHPIVQAGLALGRTTYGSPTTSDQALLNIPSLKCGPGDSARSHTADEFIYLKEIEEGIEGYIKMIERVVI